MLHSNCSGSAEASVLDVCNDMIGDVGESQRNLIRGAAPAMSSTMDEIESSAVDVDARWARQMLQDNADVIVLDVRMSVEYQEARIADGPNIDFFEDGFARRIERLDRTLSYLVLCRSGGRSRLAVELMESLGFENIHHLACGVDGWREAGFGLKS